MLIQKILSLTLLLCIIGCNEKRQVKTATVSRGVVESVVSSVNSGTVRSEKIADLSFGTVGRVKSLSIELGNQVKAGQVLAALENDDLISAYENAKNENERRQHLRTEKIVSPSEAESMVRKVAEAKSAYEKSLIAAPFDGIITELNLEIGQLSQITAVVPKPLVKIVDLLPRYVRSDIDEVDLARVRLGQLARVKVLAVRKEPFSAVVRKVVPYVSTLKEQDRTSEIELTVDSEGVLLPVGASADTEIIIERKENAIYVPSRALIGRGNSRYVYLYDSGKLRKRDVAIGLFNYDRAEILNGLADSDIVAMPSDEFEFEDGMSVEIKPN